LAGCGAKDIVETEKNDKTNKTETTQMTAEPYTTDFFAMDTYMTITAYGENAEAAVERAQERIEELDKMLSTGDEDSEVSTLNRDGEGILSEDAFYLMSRAMEICEMTDGAFDPAIYPLMEKWGFTTGDYQVPDEKEIKDLLEYISPDDILLDKDTRSVSFEKEGMEIDFGGIAKGYASAEVMQIFEEYNVSCGIVSLGGNVQVYRCKSDGSPWRIALQDPDSEDEYLGVLEIEDKAVITSGGYERYFEQDGQTYHHIIDPATGYPAENGLKSVTIISDDGVLADGLSTALYVMGAERAKEFWSAHSDAFDVILLADNGEMYVSEGVKDDFETKYDAEILRCE
jgi:thiamine biosynthesis lipoprotein